MNEDYDKGFEDGYRKAQDDVIAVLHDMASENEMPDYITSRILSGMKPEKSKPEGFTNVKETQE